MIVRAEGDFLADATLLGAALAAAGSSAGARVAVAFTAGQGARTLVLNTANDAAAEAHGRVLVAVAAADAYRIGAPGEASIAVRDDDPPSVAMAAVAARVAEGQDAVFRFTRSGPLDSALTVGVDISGLPKIMTGFTKQVAGNTHPRPDARVTFAAGAATALLRLSTEADNVNEGDGYLRADLRVSAATGWRAQPAPRCWCTTTTFPPCGWRADRGSPAAGIHGPARSSRGRGPTSPCAARETTSTPASLLAPRR